VNLKRLIKLIAAWHDHEDIHITIGVRPAVGMGAEKNYLFRLEALGHVAGEATYDPLGYVGTPIPASRRRLALRVGWRTVSSGHGMQMALR
jgi:hypothetical protein